MTTMPGFDAFAASRWPVLVRAAWLMTGDWQRSEDLAQATLVKAWRHWHRVTGADDPDRYVRRILVNEFLRSRPHWRRHETVPDEAYGASDGPEGPVVARAALAQALLSVPRRQRAVVVLRYYLDLSETETAEVLGCSVGTVKSQAARGLARLRESMPRTATRET